MADDPLNQNPPEPQPREPRSKKLVCGFCGSSLTAEGDCLRLSAEAKAFRDAADRIEQLNAEKVKLEGTIATLRDEIETLKRPTEPAGPHSSPSTRGGLRL
jgi:hypothetical protein